MKKLFALLFISMISGMIMAQIPEVSGTIVFKKDGQPVVGALVSVLGTDISTITYVDGRFILKEIPEKAQRIRVKYIGMQPKDVKIRPIMNVASIDVFVIVFKIVSADSNPGLYKECQFFL